MPIIEFDSPIAESEQSESGSGNRQPLVGYFKWKIVSSRLYTKDNGNTVWELGLDVADGPSAGKFAKFPRKIWQAVSNPVGKSIAKQMIKTIINSNVGMVNNDVLNEKSFDPSIVIGLCVGAIAEASPKGFTTIKSLCNIRVVEQQTDDNLPF